MVKLSLCSHPTSVCHVTIPTISTTTPSSVGWGGGEDGRSWVLWLESPGSFPGSAAVCYTAAWATAGKNRREKRQSNTEIKKGFSPLSLTQRGPLPFLVHIPEKDLSKSSVCVQFGVSGSFWDHPRRYQERKKKQTHGYFSDVLSFGFLLQFT